MKITIPEYVDVVLERLESAGCEAYIVGGCVRDAFTERIPEDWDVCTSASPDEISELFSDFKTADVGKKFGTILVISDGKPVEVTTFRIDGDYSDCRHPEKVTFTGSLEKDLARRDFTMNAMACDRSGRIYDPFGGLQAVQKKQISAVGNPGKRFEEDALRIMRAMRFAAVLGFEIEKETAEAMKSCSRLIKAVAPERISVEFAKLIMGENADRVIAEYRCILENVIDGFHPAKVGKLPDALPYRLAAVFPDDISENLRKLKFDKSTCSKAEKFHEIFRHPVVDDAAETCRMRRDYGDDIVSLYYEANGKKDVFCRIAEENPCCCLAALDITGNDLITAGFREGREIGKTLSYILDGVIDRKVKNIKSDLLEYARRRL